MPSKGRFDYQTYPRLVAAAETAWSGRKNKGFKSFIQRLKSFLPRLERMGIGYAQLGEAEPSPISRLFALATVALPQRKTAQPE